MSKIGLIYEDIETFKHKNIWVKDYPENPNRLIQAYKRCKDIGIIDRCLHVQAQKSTESNILLKHSKEYFDLVKSSQNMSNEDLKELSKKFDAVYFNQFTFDAAMFAAGAAIQAIKLLFLTNEEDKFDYTFALVRPPGHHAMFNEGNGYCIFNNVAIAAQYALNDLNMKRILIVDWDIHHGQGTQYMFYNDPRVLYFSSHRYEYGNFWPNLRESDYDFIGEGEGCGYNVNVPFNEVGLTNADMLSIFHQILIPLAYEYRPEIIIVSCGFDAVIGDPESKSFITPSCFAHLVSYLKSISHGKLAFIFEGGYNLKSMPESLAWTLSSLLDDICPDLGSLPPPLKSTQESILNVIRVLRPFWKCFSYQKEAQDLNLVNICMNTPKSEIKLMTELNKPSSFDLNEFEKLTIEESAFFDLQIDEIIRNSNFTSPSNRTAIAYDEVMCEHSVRNGSHPERPNRIKRIFQFLADNDILKRCKILKTRKANINEISLIHCPDYIKKVESNSALSDNELDDLEYKEMTACSIYLSKSMFECATIATGCTLQLIDEILTFQSRNGFAIVRPPGHHAEHNHEMGFCFFNSIAIAAKYALEKYQLKRILIVDWDIHHGNGTQDAFIEDPRVLFISLHRYDYGNFYPPNSNNSIKFVGSGSGKGFNINIPWSGGKHGDPEYIAAFHQIIMPIAYEFGPELVLVSAGYDAAIGDALGGYKLSPEGYGHMTKMLTNLAGGKIALILEGGYNLVSIEASVGSCVSVLLGENVAKLHLTAPHENGIQTIKNVISEHKKYWKHLSFDEYLPSRDLTLQWLEQQHGHPFYSKISTQQKTSFESTPKKTTPRSSGKKSQKNHGNLNSPQNISFNNNSPNNESGQNNINTGKKSLPNITPINLNATSDTKQADSNNIQLNINTEEEQLLCAMNDISINASDPSTNNATSGNSNSIFDKSNSISTENQDLNKNLKGATLGTSSQKSNFSNLLNLFSSIADEENQLELHAVNPLTWCPHVDLISQNWINQIDLFIDTKAPCEICQEALENWICLNCKKVLCSRYRNNHMIEHSNLLGHNMAMSFSDLSTWCYDCDSYVESQVLHEVKKAAYRDKFSEEMITIAPPIDQKDKIIFHKK